MSQQKLMFKGGALTLGGAATAAGLIGMFNGWSQKCTGTSDADRVAKGAKEAGLAFSGIQVGLAGLWTLNLLWKLGDGKYEGGDVVRFYVTAAIITVLVILTLMTNNVRAKEVDQSCKPSDSMITGTAMISGGAFVGTALIAIDAFWPNLFK